MIPPEAKHEPDAGAGIDYKFLAENCADILCSIDADHTIHCISPSCFEILGWQPAEMIARDLRHFILPDDLPLLEELEASKPPKGTAYTHARLRLIRKDQTSVWISINARCVRKSAKSLFTIFSVGARGRPSGSFASWY